MLYAPYSFSIVEPPYGFGKVKGGEGGAAGGERGDTG